MTWTPGDSSRLREFDQKIGGRFIPFLRTRLPLIEGDDIEKVALSAKYKAGAEFLLAEIENMLANHENVTDGSTTNFVSM